MRAVGARRGIVQYDQQRLSLGLGSVLTDRVRGIEFSGPSSEARMPIDGYPQAH